MGAEFVAPSSKHIFVFAIFFTFQQEIRYSTRASRKPSRALMSISSFHSPASALTFFPIVVILPPSSPPTPAAPPYSNLQARDPSGFILPFVAVGSFAANFVVCARAKTGTMFFGDDWSCCFVFGFDLSQNAIRVSSGEFGGFSFSISRQF